MNPVGITFVDDKFLPIAEEQQRNFNDFGLEHHIIKINTANYDIKLWMDIIEQTILAVRKYGKILKVDAEVRIEQELPGCWLKSNNVFFFIEPVITNPYYIALNTGQIILDDSSFQFLQYQKTLTESLIPPGYDGRLYFDDEDMTAPAIKLSNVEYLKEVIDYDRSGSSKARATRGAWKTKHTILTHPFIHNWNTDAHNMSNRSFFRNHFGLNDSVQFVDMAIGGLEKQITSKKFWQYLGFEHVKKDVFTKDGWYVEPAISLFWNDTYPTKKSIFD